MISVSEAAIALSETELREVLQAGILAPSADNHHRVRFERLEGGNLEMTATGTADWNEQPHRQLLDLLASGAIVENIALRSLEFGRALQVQWFPDPLRRELTASLHWVAARTPPDPLAQAIASRQTHRGFYRRAPLSPTGLERMHAAAASNPGAELVWLDTAARRTAALHAIRLAEAERFKRRALHAELFGAIRFDVGWSETAENGLPPATLAVEPPLRAVFAQLRRWPLMRALNWVGASQALAMRSAYLPAMLAPHLGAIVSLAPPLDRPQDENRGDDLRHQDAQAGRALQRAWLAASAEGFAFQPFAAATALIRQRAGAGWVDADAQIRLTEIIAGIPLGQGRPAIFFRVGSARPMPCATKRPPLSRFLNLMDGTG